MYQVYVLIDNATLCMNRPICQETLGKEATKGHVRSRQSAAERILSAPPYSGNLYLNHISAQLMVSYRSLDWIWNDIYQRRLKLRDHIIVMLLISSISYIPRSVSLSMINFWWWLHRKIVTWSGCPLVQMVAEEEATESSPKSLPLYLEDAVSHPQEETNSNHRGEIKSIHIEDTECSHQEVTKLNSKNETKSSSPQEEYIFPLNNSKQRKSAIQQSCWCLIKQRSGGWDRLVGRRIQGQSSLHTWRNKGKLLQAK